MPHHYPKHLPLKILGVLALRNTQIYGFRVGYGGKIYNIPLTAFEEEFSLGVADQLPSIYVLQVGDKIATPEEFYLNTFPYTYSDRDSNNPFIRRVNLMLCNWQFEA